MNDRGDKEMPFQLISGVNEKWKAEGDLPIAASGDGHCITVGDDVYILTEGESSKLLARLSVLGVSVDAFRHRIDLKIGGPRSAVFFDNSSNAVPINVSTSSSTPYRYEVHCLDPESAQQLIGVCGSHDFSSSAPVRWDAISQQVRTNVTRASRDGDPRPDLEIAESFLRRNYVTSQLPGPAPVYQNAARQALGQILPSRPSVPRRRHLLTREEVQRGINEDVATAGQTPNTSRHQEILDRLRARLKQIGLVPMYDGLVDCIVEVTDADIYFEVKSTSPESVVPQVRTGLGQVLHYMWMDTDAASRTIRGHLVVEGPWADQNVSLRDFLESCLVRLTWSQDIPSMETSDLEALRASNEGQSSHTGIGGDSR